MKNILLGFSKVFSQLPRSSHIAAWGAHIVHEGRPLSTRMNMFGSIRKYFVQNEKYENKITVFNMPDVLSPQKFFEMNKNGKGGD